MLMAQFRGVDRLNFIIADRLKGSIDFLADKTLASPSRAIIIRLDLLDPANDPIVNVLVPSWTPWGAVA